jgi:nicotinamide mononucleotide (NMN) deamidase PncC/nicotinic acid mononucleotide adenylyltransferase
MVPDAALPGALKQLPFASTLFFPVSGNPIGFNHLAAAEWMLRRHPAWERVLFVLSNGRHPDPTKPGAEVDAATRLDLCRLSIAAAADPARSFLAKQAAQAGETLRLGPETVGISTRELSETGAVRTAQMVAWLRSEAPPGQGPVAWCVGTDLVRRMADPRIFSDADLPVLARECRLAVLERPGEPTAKEALKLVQERRGVTLPCDVFLLADLPEWLAKFLHLSSTLIRNAAEAGDPLGGMLPAGPAEAIVRNGLYRGGRSGARLMAPDGKEVGTRTQWQLTVDRTQAALDAEAGRVFDLLTQRHAAREPHGLAIVEGCVGGVLTASLAGRAGASRFFRQSRFAYDRQGKVNLIGEYPQEQSAASTGIVSALARALRDQALADYCVAESGAAGPPDGVRRSFKNGECWLAAVGPDGERTEHVALNPFLTRKEHMLEFSRRALLLLRKVVEGR